MHLRIHKISNIVPTIGPLKNAESADLTFLKISSINVDAVLVAPFFKALTIDLTFVKDTANLNRAIINFLNSFTFYFIFEPHTFIFLLIYRLLVLAFTVKHSVLKCTNIDTSVRKRLLSLPVWKVIYKFSCVNRAIRVTQSPLSLFDAVTPLTLKLSTILPSTRSKCIHFTLLPLT